MDVIIKPSKLKGDVIVPPSKSLSHRAIIAASLASGKSVISNIIYSKDIISTINAVRACGAIVEEYSDHLVIYGSSVKRVSNLIDACESGSTIRFMIPIALVNEEPITFTGQNHLVKRPLDTYTNIFDIQNIEYKKEENYLPLYVNGGLKSGEYKIRGDISSQFITGLLYALPLLDGDSTIVITTKLESIGYIDLTLDMLKMFNINIEVSSDYKTFYIKGRQQYMPCDYTVEGDYSQVAFFLVASTLGADLNLINMNEKSHQGDMKILQDIIDFKGEYTFKDSVLKAYEKKTYATTISFAQSPDLGPILCVLAALSSGVSNFIDVSRLRIKECDRVSAMILELAKLGVTCSETEDTMTIHGKDMLNGSLNLDSHNDHRIVMALAIASIKCSSEIRIKNAQAINKSFPHFFEVFESIGGNVLYEE